MVTQKEMELPQQFKYAARWGYLLYLLALGSLLISLGLLRMIHPQVGIGLGIIPFGLATWGILRRLLVPGLLEIRPDALLMRSGIGQGTSVEIPFAEIEQVREVRRFTLRILHLRTASRHLEVVSALLPSLVNYKQVRNHVRQRFEALPAAAPCPPAPREPGGYWFRCGYDGCGEVHYSNGEVLWRFETRHFSSQPRLVYGLFRVPDFVVYDRENRELFRFRVIQKWPLARFEMLEQGSRVCGIRLRSFLRNQYELTFATGTNWRFGMGLFSVGFGGYSDQAKFVRVRVRSHNLWQVLVDPAADNPQLVAALAFLHRERLRFN